MVTLKQLRRMVELYNYAGQKDLSKELNRIRGRAFGRAYVDLTYVCKQAQEVLLMPSLYNVFGYKVYFWMISTLKTLTLILKMYNIKIMY